MLGPNLHRRQSKTAFWGAVLLELSGLLGRGLAEPQAPPGTVRVIRLEPKADKGVTTGDFPGGLRPQDPTGQAPLMRVSQQVWWAVHQALIRFDLSWLPPTLQVQKATLELYVAEFQGWTAGQAPEPMQVRVVSLPPYDLWDEASATFQTRDATHRWSGEELHRSVWKVLDTQTVTQRGRWCRWEVTAAVRDHHEGRFFLSGLALQADDPMNTWGDLTNSPGQVGFATKEFPYVTLRPRLVVAMGRPPRGPKLTPKPPPTQPSQLRRMPPPPYIVWYQCPFLDDLRRCNVDASVGSLRWAFENHGRGITALMWVYGPNLYGEAKDWDAERFVRYYGSYADVGYAGMAMDEWNVGDDHPYVPVIAEALRNIKRQHPDFFIAVWVTEPTPVFRSLVQEGTIDLALIEGYTFVPDHPEWAISWEGVIRRVEMMQQEGLLARTIVCVGFVAARPDQYGNRMTAAELRRQVGELARRYPQMPGVAFYGYADGDLQTRALVRLADRLANRFHADRRQ